MYKYYISELNLKNNNFKKLTKDIDVTSKDVITLLSINGKYTIDNEYINHYIINDFDNEDLIIKNYLEKYTLLISKLNWKSVKKSDIKNDHIEIIIHEDIYKISKNTDLVVETVNNVIKDIYVKSNLKYDNFSLKEDISYLLTKIIL